MTINSKHKLPASSNVLDPNLSPERPNAAWAGDITFVWTREGWLYLAEVFDPFSREVIGWDMEPTLGPKIAIKALIIAIRTRQQTAGLLFHSDQGVQETKVA